MSPETPPPTPTDYSPEELLAISLGFQTRTSYVHKEDLGDARELEERRQAEIARRLAGPPAPDYSALVSRLKLLKEEGSTSADTLSPPPETSPTFPKSTETRE